MPPPRQRLITAPRVLVVGDTELPAPDIVGALQKDGCAVAVAPDSGSPLELVLEASRHDLIILDGADRPHDRLGFLKALRDWSVQTPVIVVLDHDRVTDKVGGLDAGGDDVVARPVAGEELCARVRALLRRPAATREPILRLADLTLDPVTREVRRGARRLSLTPKEFTLLDYFLRNVGRVLTRCMILERVWDLGFDPESNLVDVYVGQLRRKIEGAEEQRLLHTVRGMGYILALER